MFMPSVIAPQVLLAGTFFYEECTAFLVVSPRHLKLEFRHRQQALGRPGSCRLQEPDSPELVPEPFQEN